MRVRHRYHVSFPTDPHAPLTAEMEFTCAFNSRACEGTVLHDKYVHGMLDSFLASPRNDEFSREFPGPPVKVDLPGGGVGVDVTLMAYHLHRVRVPHNP